VLLRHGTTEWSATGRHTSRTDVDLLPEGEADARRAGTLLADRVFARIHVSPRRRARRTAELAALAAADTVIDEDLVEWDYGEVEGRTTAELRVDRPGWTVWDGPVPGGETLAEVAARADRVIARLRADAGDQAVIAHGHVLRVLAARWCGWPPIDGRHLPLEAGAVCELGWERETPALLAWNRG
jgi:broad specificity phosphatase PhoE